MISVVIPVRNEGQFIERTIQSLLANTFAEGDFEVIVVDGASTDETASIVRRLSATNSRVKLLTNDRGITPVGMNLGIAAAQGDVIAVVGGHSWFAPDYLSACIAVLRRTGAGCVGGYMETVPGDSSETAKAICAATTSIFGVGGSTFRTGGNVDQSVDTVAFGACPRSVYDKVGRYNPTLLRNQDIDFSSRARKAGYAIIISPTIKFKYFGKTTFRQLASQAYNNGFWNPRTILLAGAVLRPRHFAPLVFVVGLAVLAACVAVHPAFVWSLAGLIGVYGIALVTFSALAVRLRGTNPAMTMLAFAILHLAYGWGSLWSIVTLFLHHRESLPPQTDTAHTGTT